MSNHTATVEIDPAYRKCWIEPPGPRMKAELDQAIAEGRVKMAVPPPMNATKDNGDIYGDQCADTEGDGWETYGAAAYLGFESNLDHAIAAVNYCPKVSNSPLMQQAQANAMLASQAAASADNAFVPARPPVDQSGSVTYRAEDIMKIFDELANLKAQNAVLLAELTELKRTRPRQTIVDHFLAMPRSALRGGNGIPFSPL